jgi:hypothetical protein
MRSDHSSRVPATGLVSRGIWILIVPLLATGCATQRFATLATQAAKQPFAVAAASATKVVETRYEVRDYRERTNPQVRHEAHAVYRSTRVPLASGDELATVPREAYPDTSFTPLPASEELAAELATQKSITAEIRAMQTSMAEAERRVQSQYASLVRESAEALKVREQLEAERARTWAAATSATRATPAVAPTGGTSEVKW